MKLARSAVIKVEFYVAVPVGATLDEIDEWVSFEAGIGSIEAGNLLNDHDLEALNRPVLTFTGLYLHERVEDLGNGTYRTHREMLPEPFTGPSALSQVCDLVTSRK